MDGHREILRQWLVMYASNLISDCTSSDEIAEEPMIGIKKLILGSALTSQRRFQSAIVACK